MYVLWLKKRKILIKFLYFYYPYGYFFFRFNPHLDKNMSAYWKLPYPLWKMDYRLYGISEKHRPPNQATFWKSPTTGITLNRAPWAQDHQSFVPEQSGCIKSILGQSQTHKTIVEVGTNHIGSDSCDGEFFYHSPPFSR